MQYLLREHSVSSSYQEISDSMSVVEFGERHLSVPGKKAGLKARIFLNQSPEEVLQKRHVDSEKSGEGKTINGISSKFEYICKVRQIFCRHFLTVFFIFRQMARSCGAGSLAFALSALDRDGKTVNRRMWLDVSRTLTFTRVVLFNNVLSV